MTPVAVSRRPDDVMNAATGRFDPSHNREYCGTLDSEFRGSRVTLMKPRLARQAESQTPGRAVPLSDSQDRPLLTKISTRADEYLTRLMSMFRSDRNSKRRSP